MTCTREITLEAERITSENVLGAAVTVITLAHDGIEGGDGCFSGCAVVVGVSTASENVMEPEVAAAL